MSQRTTDATKRRCKLTLGLALLATLLCGGGLAIGVWLVGGALAFGDTDQDDVAPAVVENVARIRLPARTHELRSRLGGFQDRFIFVRFRMPASELTTFERSLSCALGPPSAVVPEAHAGKRPDWFTQPLVSRSCQGSGPGFHQTVIVDVASPTDVVVHVTVFES